MIGYFRRLRRKRQHARIAARLEVEVIAMFTAVPPPEPPTPAEVLANTYAAMDAYESLPRPTWDVGEKGPIKLTRVQIDRMKAANPPPSTLYSGLVGALYGLPIVEVATAEESTPYTEGWIKP